MQTGIAWGIGHFGWRSTANLSGDRALSRSCSVFCSDASGIRRPCCVTFALGCRALFPYLYGSYETNLGHALGLPITCWQLGGYSRGLWRQPRHDPREYTHVAPPLPANEEGLGGAIHLGCITLEQPNAINEYNATQHTSVINTWHTMVLRKIRLEPRQLIFAQPVKISHNPRSIWEN